MGLERELEKLVEQKKVEKCELCHNRMQYVGGGKYRCSFCGMEILDDFGKIKYFLEQNGPTPQAIIAQQTGISLDKIDSYVVDFHKDIKLGMEKTAEKQGLNSFNDITIIDDDQHPLIAITQTIKNAQQKQK